MSRGLRTFAVLAVAAAALLAGCSKNSGGPTGASGTGHMSIAMTDATSPDVQAAVVTISKIYLVGNAADTANASGQVVLMSTPVTTDLLTLSNDVDQLVDSAAVDAGTYTQLRFVIDGGYIQTVDAQGNTHVYATANYAHAPATVDGTLTCPSCGQSGIKVNLQSAGGLTVSDAQSTSLLVDFNVADTFGHQAGNSSQWVMHPTLKASEVSLAGKINVSLVMDSTLTLPSVAGSVLTLADFKAELKPSTADSTSPGETLSLGAVTSDSAAATFNYIVPGSYTVTLVGPDSVTFTTTPVMQNVDVSAGASASAAFKLDSVALISGG